MDILNVVTTKNAACTTENAVYNLEYSISNNELLKVMTTIYSQKTKNRAEEIYIGQIISENGITTASFMGNVPASKLFSDYENLMQEIKKDVNSK
jgi:hypothetical protein